MLNLNHITRMVETSVIVNVESLFTDNPKPPQDILLHDPSEVILQPPGYQQTSLNKSTEHSRRQYQTPTDQLAGDNLLQGLWGDSRTTCRGLILDLTSSSNTTHLALRLVEISGLWRLPETVVIAIGGRTGVRSVLLHHSLRNTVHALYLTLHHDLLHASFNAHLPNSESRLGKLLSQEASTNSGVRVYSRCLYCNNGEADVQLVHNLNINSPDLLWVDLFQERFQDFMDHKTRIVTASIASPYIVYQRVSEAPGTAVLLRDSLDARLIHTFAVKLNFTYVVDIFLPVPDTEHLQHVNATFERLSMLSFTYEMEKEGTLPFLDVTVSERLQSTLREPT
nr:uncharacterized protein LOC123749459 [Procambarus clarkii]